MANSVRETRVNSLLSPNDEIFVKNGAYNQGSKSACKVRHVAYRHFLKIPEGVPALQSKFVVEVFFYDYFC
jgi:hypothetical protein